MLLVTKAAFISLQSTRKEKVSKQNLPYSFYQRQGILLGLFFLLLWFVFDYTNLDYWVSAQVFDFKNHVSTDYFAKFIKSLKQPGDIRSN